VIFIDNPEANPGKTIKTGGANVTVIRRIEAVNRRVAVKKDPGTPYSIDSFEPPD
jgi:hypothetical protein